MNALLTDPAYQLLQTRANNTAGIGLLWLVPYMETAEAAFYEEVKADYALHGGLI